MTLDWLRIGIVFCSISSLAQAKGPNSSPTVQTAAEVAMKVFTIKDQPSAPGPAQFFTGAVRVTMLLAANAPSELTCGSVAFQAGARSNWHTHPRGQLLIVTDGNGLIQEWGKPVRRIKPGDVVWTPPGVKHWHGASAASRMTHTAVQETSDGKSVEWLERVTDSDYSATSP